MRKVSPFLIAALFFTQISCPLSGMSSLYCRILGNIDARAEYQEQVREALRAFNVSHPDAVPIKKMNGVGPAWARVPLASFTAFGIWLDEEALDSCDETTRTFQLYHEAAHYDCKHHQKLLASGLVVISTVGVGAAVVKQWLPPVQSKTGVALATGLGIAGLGGIYRYALPALARKQEKEADIKAAQLLCATGKRHIVEQYIHKLEKQLAQHGDAQDIWWYSLSEQVNYLRDCLA